MYQLSKHNIISRISGSNEYFIVNLLSGNADILDEATYNNLNDLQLSDDLLERGYLTNPDEERKLFRKKYLDFIDSRENDEIQIFFVPWYACNFACSYCYQDEYENEKTILTTQVIDAFFKQIQTQFPNRKKYITLFGGEPLLTGSTHKSLVLYFLQKVKETNLQVAIVTNGYTLKEYLPAFSKEIIREIQVTLDGTAGYHNKRRYLKDHSPTFLQISEGIDLLLQNNYPVNLRMVVDRENLADLPDFAQCTIDKGWTGSPNFKTQLGRNYELHHCQSQRQKLYTRLELYQDLYKLVQEHPHILEFHKPAYSISKFLFENGELPEPLFDSCPACKTEWAFDFTGKIYPCTATVGKKDEQVGEYYPAFSLNESMVCNWEERDVTAINDCKNCSLQLACGGGCGSVAKNRTGSVNSPDCRPVKELLEMGISLYNKG